MAIAIASALLANTCSVALAQAPVGGAAVGQVVRSEMAQVFHRRVKAPPDVLTRGGRKVWKGKKFDKDNQPRFSRSRPAIGDFVVYYVHTTHRGPLKTTIVASELLLELVRPSPDTAMKPYKIGEPSQSVLARVYGASYDADEGGRVSIKGLALNRTFHDPAYQAIRYWPVQNELETFRHGTMSVADVGYFRDYVGEARSEYTTVDECVLTDLGSDDRLGTLYRFKFEYAHPGGVDAGVDTLVLSEKVPVRGVLWAKDVWASSSGIRNHQTTMTLLNNGRLTDGQLQKLLNSEDPIEEELALWKSLLEAARAKER